MQYDMALSCRVLGKQLHCLCTYKIIHIGPTNSSEYIYGYIQFLNLRITYTLLTLTLKQLEIAQSEQDVSPCCKESDMT